MKAIVNQAICPLKLRPSHQCELADEALFGMVVEVLEESHTGWYQVETGYRYQGYAPSDCLLMGESNVARWEALPKLVILKNSCDILSAPNVQGWCMVSLNRGCLVSPVGEILEGGWQKVSLPDGREGFSKSGFLGDYHQTPSFEEEDQLRAAVVRTAMSYMGTHYRWGGKTPQGVDCSGLVSMAYLLNGVVIWRDASIKEGFALRKINPDDMKKGDLVFFPGHVAMYLGRGEFLHSTARNGSDGVVLNSFDPNHPRYSLDLAKTITEVGSVFPL